MVEVVEPAHVIGGGDKTAALVEPLLQTATTRIVSVFQPVVARSIVPESSRQVQVVVDRTEEALKLKISIEHFQLKAKR